MIRNLIKLIWEMSQTLAFSLGILVVVYNFFFMPQVVMGTSSYPTIKPEERLIVDRISYKFNQPQRGDFIVLQSPNNPDIDFIKRIIGLPGETIEISSCKVLVNDQILPEPYLKPGVCTTGESFLSENIPLQITRDHYFVMGDNRSHSNDSRDFGTIRKDTIVGKAIFRWWPPERFGEIN